MRKTFGLIYMLLVLVSLAAATSEMTYAAEPETSPRSASQPTSRKPVLPSNLIGNVVPRCDPGKVAGGNICKASPPGYYAPGGVLYALSCPKGSYSLAGSRALSECLYPDGRPAANKFEETLTKSTVSR
jgi:hypothetical protein